MKHHLIFILCLITYGYSLSSEDFWTHGYTQAIEGKWGEVESLSGPGSTLKQTTLIRSKLTVLITQFKIKTILDLPCGDFNWMRYIELGNCDYIGADIIAPLIERNVTLYKNNKRSFLHLDATKDTLPTCDLIICRDLLVHLSRNDTFAALRNFKKSGAKYLLTTTFVGKNRTHNEDICTGEWYPINLQIKPFNFPEPLLIINEECSEQGINFNDKSLGLWELDHILSNDI